jgi:hypothetical protein
LYDQSVTVPGPAVDRLGGAAADAGVYLAVGVNEVDGGTFYNALLYFARKALPSMIVVDRPCYSTDDQRRSRAKAHDGPHGRGSPSHPFSWRTCPS